MGDSKRAYKFGKHDGEFAGKARVTKLRIISGALKGKYITLGNGVNYRPTQERVREAVAEIVKKKVVGAKAADLCAGSGAFGFEMISRGAAHVDFIELDRALSVKIADNAKLLGVYDRVRVISGDVKKFVNDNRCSADVNGDICEYDIIFYDPPYDNIEMSDFVLTLPLLLKKDGLLIYERRRRQSEKRAATVTDKQNPKDARIYSDTVIEIYERCP